MGIVMQADNESCSTSQARRLTILGVFLALYAITSFNRSATGIIAPLLQHDFSLNDRQLTTIVTGLFFANVIFQLPAGALVDRFGARLSISGFLLIGAAGGLWFAIGRTFGELTFARILMGVGYCVIQPAAYTLFARYFPADRFATLVGFLIAAGSTGGLFGTLPFAVLVDVVGWGAIYVGLAAVTAILALVNYLAVDGEQQGDKRVVESPVQVVAGITKVFRNKQFLLMLPLALMSFAPLTTITGLWGTPYLERVYGYATKTQGIALLGVFLAALAGSLFFGPLDRRFNTRKWIVVPGAAVSAACFLTLALLPIGQAPIAVALLAVMALAQQFGVTLSAHMRSIFPVGSVGRATACFTLVSILGIPLMQWLFGSVLSLAQQMNLSIAGSFRMAFGAIAVCIALATTIYLWTHDLPTKRE